MRNYLAGEYDIVVIGAGHAGCEAALASARMGMKTLVLTMNLESIAMMPCNPSIGGTGKGHLVHEIDALGGQMGICADMAALQSKMLNTSKGPAVHSLRMQEDKLLYQRIMKQVLERQQNLDLKQAEVSEILFEEAEGVKTVKGVVTTSGSMYHAKRIVIATGTFLKSTVLMGHSVTSSGPNGLRPASFLSESLRKMGVNLRRLKTGTPPRIHKRSIDFSKLELYMGDTPPKSFSFLHGNLEYDEIPCYLVYTNGNTHEAILNNLNESAIYSGNITGVGPRYCPSIEDKLVRFKERERHQVFIEPEGRDTDELYAQGMSTSLPEDVQYQFIRTIPGFENVEITRSGYAIEYDCIDSASLKLSLESLDVAGLFCAGQFNGSSGYEEAAAQGLIAGINAVLSLRGEEPFILDRSQAYIGVLIDDMVTKGTDEPYRIMTGRCEYRLVLRQDNADERLTPIGRKIGLVDDERYEVFLKKREAIEREYERIRTTKIKPENLNELFKKFNMNDTAHSKYIEELLRRPEINYKELEKYDLNRPEELSDEIIEYIEIELKYEGYIQKQLQQIKKFKQMENKILPQDIDYQTIDGLRIEARQRLNKIKPHSIGQASRIYGVSPADISVLLIYLEKRRRNHDVE